MRALFLLLLTVSAGFGQLLPGIDPRPPDGGPVESLPPVRRGQAGESDGPDRVLLERLERIDLLGLDSGPLSDVTAAVNLDPGLLVPSPVTLVARLSPWIGRSLTDEGLVRLADEILIHYGAEGYPVVLVDVPEQDLAAGRLEIRVEIGRIGRVGVSRPKYGDPGVIREGLHLHSGDMLRRSELDEQMAWYGRSIFRRPRLFVSPGETPAAADLLIALEERKPWRVSIGYEDSGPDVLGRDRFLLGAAGMLPGEQIVAWQSVLGAPASSLSAHALSWEIPFHRIHQTLLINAAYAEVSGTQLVGGMPPAVIDTEGTSWSLSMLERFHLPGVAGWRQRLSLGFELKSTDQFLLFGEARIAPGEVRLLHARAGYQLDREWDGGAAAFGLDLLASPGGWIGGNDDADFQAYDPRADARYVVGRLGANGWWSLWGDWRLAWRGSAQLADSRLLPVEQMAAGGYQTVRGVGEREYFADNGCLGSLELYTPAMRPTDWCQLRLLGFVDRAWLRNRGADSTSLGGAGLGVRASLTRMVELRADYGWRLDDDEERAHVGVAVTF